MITLSSSDTHIVRDLALKIAEIAALPIQRQREKEWKRLNSLKPGRPLVLVWHYETPWQELDGEELRLQCKGEFCKGVEQNLRRTLFQWKHFPGDMVVDNYIECYPSVHDTGHGIQWNPDEAKSDGSNPIVSRHFKPVIKEPEDIQKIVMPTVTVDREATSERLATMQELFAGIMPVKMGGPRGYWFCPMDELIVYWGIQEMLTDLVMRPDMVHAGMERMTQWHESRVRQWEDLGVLTLNNNARIINTGGYGCTDQLPAKGFTPEHVRTLDSWGSAATQIFGTVSPEMHWEFSSQYEARFLKRFGLVSYGCCDPLHHKQEVVKRIPNVRRLSMSPWADHETGAEWIGNHYVYSFKPNPALLAEETWDPAEARRQIRRVLDITKKHDCVVEIILKDISTARGELKRISEWTRIAKEEAEAVS
jgi:hypothetical protein